MKMGNSNPASKQISTRASFIIDAHYDQVGIRPVLRNQPEDRPRLKLPIYDRNHRNEPYRRA